jgi:F-type H+-transporting ATPase subunit b
MTLPLHLTGLVLAEEGGLLDPQPGLSFWFLLTFIIVAVVLKWKVWGPLSDAISSREKAIQDSVDSAKKEREQAEKLLSEQQTLVTEARREAGEMVRKSHAEVEKAKEQLFAQARTEAEALLKDARKAIEEEKRKALFEIRTVAVDLAISAASKLVAQKLDDGSHRALAEEFIAGVQSDGTRAKLSA